MKRKPMLALREFLKQHQEARRKISKHCVQARGRKNVSDELLERMADRNARSFKTTNMRSRIVYMGAASIAFEALHPADRQFAFVTLTPKIFATTLSDAPDFDHEELKAWTCRALRRFSFVAVVEGGYFTNLNVVPGIREPMVSWHVPPLSGGGCDLGLGFWRHGQIRRVGWGRQRGGRNRRHSLNAFGRHARVGEVQVTRLRLPLCRYHHPRYRAARTPT